MKPPVDIIYLDASNIFRKVSHDVLCVKAEGSQGIGKELMPVLKRKWGCLQINEQPLAFRRALSWAALV